MLSPEISPTGRQIAFEVTPFGDNDSDVFVLDLERNQSTRLVRGESLDAQPTWSLDGDRTAFFSRLPGGQSDVYVREPNPNGESSLLLQREGNEGPHGWSRDGEYLLFHSFSSFGHVSPTSNDVRAVRLRDGTEIAVAATAAFEADPEFSPDGAWVAYRSNLTGQPQIYVKSFPDLEQVVGPIAAGTQPRWRSDGRELYYLRPDGWLMALAVPAEADMGQFDRWGAATPLFPAIQALFYGFFAHQ